MSGDLLAGHVALESTAARMDAAVPAERRE
jgi:hypothetical protein